MSSPLDFILDTCASTSSSHFFCWWSWTYVFVPFETLLKGQMYLQPKKHVFCNLGTRWHKILEFVSSCPIYGWRSTLWLRLNQKLRIGLVMRLSPVGQPLQITRKYSAKKRSSPLDFIFNTCASTSSSHFFGEAEHMCLYPFARANVSSPLQAFHGGIFLLVITFVIPESACEGFFVKKQPLYYIFTPSHLQI